MEIIFNQLTSLIKKYDKIVLMTHKHPDFDGIGSALGLQQIINTFKKESYLCINGRENNKSLNRSFKLLEDNHVQFKKITKESALNLENYLLIILDTHKENMVEQPELIKKCKEIVVIDHHIKSKNYIKSTNFTYINSNLSSTVEFISKYIKYLNKTINPLIATMMLVGLEIDTYNYRLKTTAETYEASAFLTRMGADNILKQELLQEDKENYLKRKQVIEDTQMINDNMALCVSNNKIYEPKDLAEIAEEMLQFENVQASFVIGFIDKNLIGISSRSLGKINVEEIMNKMGGGGHFSEAAAQIKNSTVLKVRKQLLETISESNKIDK